MDVWEFYVLPQSGETMSSVSAGHIILTPTQPVGSGGPGPPHHELRPERTELPGSPTYLRNGSIFRYCVTHRSMSLHQHTILLKRHREHQDRRWWYKPTYQWSDWGECKDIEIRWSTRLSNELNRAINEVPWIFGPVFIPGPCIPNAQHKTMRHKSWVNEKYFT